MFVWSGGRNFLVVFMVLIASSYSDFSYSDFAGICQVVYRFVVMSCGAATSAKYCLQDITLS